ncbi:MULTISPECIES: formylglycine-generating enzyme family protein [Microcoleaceae]|uniref:formylglycine-generating enzyme family protein n=1 Tax=Microcoleaceae TaxID=1892252 RepID=UPI001882F71B|nr:formylglycine-generating enzyme family protein [Tychonema sp. LEGE 06208]
MNNALLDPGQNNPQSQLNDFLQSLDTDTLQTVQHSDLKLTPNHLPDYSQQPNFIQTNQPDIVPDLSQAARAESHPNHDWHQTSGLDAHHQQVWTVNSSYATVSGCGIPAAAAEPLRREAEASKGKEFIFEIITVDKHGKPTNKQSGKAYQKEEDLGNGIKLEMVHIRAGSFMMGAPSGEGDDDERPQHKVTFAQPFYLGKYPITQEQWQAVMGNNPSYFKGGKRPVENVSWDDAVSFCQKLSEKTGKIYRLPNEAEWEYACRAGTTTAFHFGETITPDLVNCDGNNPYGAAPKGFYRQETTPVGSFGPNAFGLYDMHGNIWEWCADPWHDNYNGAPSDGSSWETGRNDDRVLRGGSWNLNAVNCRATYRSYNSAGHSQWDWGFRVVSAAVWTP